MTNARMCRQLLYTILLMVVLRACGCLPAGELVNAQDAQAPTRPPDPTITISVYPQLTLLQVGHGTADVMVRVTVPRDARNRVLCVVVDGPIYRSSCWEHGPTAQYRQEFAYRSLPAGDYVAVGELQWVDGAKGERRTTVSRFEFRILSGGE